MRVLEHEIRLQRSCLHAAFQRQLLCLLHAVLYRLVLALAIGSAARAHGERCGDEHGRVVFANGEDRLPVGAAVELVTPHCDPTVNLHDWYHVVRGDTLVDIWPIDARGVL